jgi:hypothetical protein
MLGQVATIGKVAALPTASGRIYAPTDRIITQSGDGFMIPPPSSHVWECVVAIENSSIVIESASVAMSHFHDFGAILYKKTLEDFEAFVLQSV